MALGTRLAIMPKSDVWGGKGERGGGGGLRPGLPVA